MLEAQIRANRACRLTAAWGSNSREPGTDRVVMDAVPTVWRAILQLTVALIGASCSKTPHVALPRPPAFPSPPQMQVPESKILSSFSVLMKTECEVHRRPLSDAVVPIEYWYVDHDPTYLGARPRMFPGAVDVVGGGCIEGEGTHARRVDHCAGCHPVDSPLDPSVEHRLQVDDGRSVQRLQVSQTYRCVVGRHDRHPVQPDRVRPMRRSDPVQLAARGAKRPRRDDQRGEHQRYENVTRIVA
jgi:hypothetical protein